jgi:hypothetical protein
VTMNDDHCTRGNNRVAAAKNARSGVVSGGRPTRRRNTASSWRSTTISKSFKSLERKPEDYQLPNAVKCDVTDRQKHDASLKKDESAAILRRSTKNTPPAGVRRS